MKTTIIITLMHFAFLAVAHNGDDSNTTTKVNRTDEQGRKQGKWILLGKDQPEKGYPKEGKICEGVYKNDRKNGKWIVYFKDGETPKIIGEFENNRPNGKFQKFYPNGNLKEVATFRDQLYTDTLKRYSVDGTLTYQAYYNEDGQESGVVKYFYDNGIPKFVYHAENGSPKGKATRYWDNGDIREEIIFNKDGQWLTTSGEIPKTKPLLKEVESTPKEAPRYKEEKNIQGSDKYNIIFNKSKEIWMEGEFRNNKLWNGRLYIYDNDGLLKKVEVYRNGVYHSDSQL